jgi:hypothetical protein
MPLSPAFLSAGRKARKKVCAREGETKPGNANQLLL